MPDNLSFATSGSDDDTVKLWSSVDGHRCLMTITCPDIIECLLALDPQNILAGLMNGSIVRINFDWPSGYQSIVEFNRVLGSVAALEYSHDGHLILTGNYDGKVMLWDKEGGGFPEILEGRSRSVSCLAVLPPAPSSLSFSDVSSAHKKLAVSGSDDSTIVVWDLVGKRGVKTLLGHRGRVSKVVCISPERIVSGGNDGGIRLWNVFDGTCIHQIACNVGVILSLAVLSNEVIAFSGNDTHDVFILDVNKRKQLQDSLDMAILLIV